jgi:hypothetical protein
MFVLPTENNEAGSLLDGALAFLSTKKEGARVAFVLVVDRNGDWVSVHDRDGEQVPGDDQPMLVSRVEVATWLVGQGNSTCIRQRVNGFEQHIHY